jgi:hypothetical protein
VPPAKRDLLVLLAPQDLLHLLAKLVLSVKPESLVKRVLQVKRDLLDLPEQMAALE